MDTQTETRNMVAVLDWLWYALARLWRQSLAGGDPGAAPLRESLDLIWAARAILEIEAGEVQND